MIVLDVVSNLRKIVTQLLTLVEKLIVCITLDYKRHEKSKFNLNYDFRKCPVIANLFLNLKASVRVTIYYIVRNVLLNTIYCLLHYKFLSVSQHKSRILSLKRKKIQDCLSIKGGSPVNR